MAIVDVQDSLVQISATGSSYATIADLTSWNGTHGEESQSKVRVFGRANPYVRAGDDTDEYSLSGLYNLADTNGQNILRTAKDNRTTVFLRVLPEGATSGDQGYTQECNVTEYTDAGDAGGEYVEVSFALSGVGTRTPYTVPT